MREPATVLFSPPRISMAVPRVPSKTSSRTVRFATPSSVSNGSASSERITSAPSSGPGGQK